MSQIMLTRRRLLGIGAMGASGLVLAGCDQFDFLGNRENAVRDTLEQANNPTYRAQRLLVDQNALAREYSESEIRQGQRPNGSTDPTGPEYLVLKANDFADYRLTVTGLVERPATFSLAELPNMPVRTRITRHDCVTRITRHDCVEGWSTIAKWTGTPLAGLLDQVRVKPQARFAVYHCYDSLGGAQGPVPFYGSSDLVDARHPQTILAYGLNDKTLPVSRQTKRLATLRFDQGDDLFRTRRFLRKVADCAYAPSRA